MFLDEPTVKLDAKGAQAVRELVTRINREYGITVILTTHYIFEAEELRERVAIMHRGKIKSCDTVANLRRNLQRYDEFAVACREIVPETAEKIRDLPFVVSCALSGNKLTVQMENIREGLIQVLRTLRACGVGINEIATNELTLEDIFADTIGAGGKP